VDGVLGSAVVVLVAATFASALFVVEAALPTVGLAGTAGLACGALAVAGVAHQEATWWPLTGVAFAIVVWSVLVARHHAPARWQAVAAVLFAGGGVGFGLYAHDAATVATALAGAALLALGYPRLFAAAARLDTQPPAVGIESLVGRRAEVVDWSGTSGTVRLDGSLWTAVADGRVARGSTVVIDGRDGFTLHVEAETTKGRAG
jgi:membrane-bound ClpP family serine protease